MGLINEEGCSCHVAPPCGFCTDTFECIACNGRWHKDDCAEGDCPETSVCADCVAARAQAPAVIDYLSINAEFARK